MYIPTKEQTIAFEKMMAELEAERGPEVVASIRARMKKDRQLIEDEESGKIIPVYPDDPPLPEPGQTVAVFVPRAPASRRKRSKKR